MAQSYRLAIILVPPTENLGKRLIDMEATVKGELDLHKQVSFVWDETHPVDTAK